MVGIRTWSVRAAVPRVFVLALAAAAAAALEAPGPAASDAPSRVDDATAAADAPRHRHPGPDAVPGAAAGRPPAHQGRLTGLGHPVGSSSLQTGLLGPDGRAAVQDALGEADVAILQDQLASGQAVLCCGYWRDAAAARLQQRVADELGISLRRLGDVHLSNSSSKITSSLGRSGVWGAVAVLYLDAPASSAAVLERADGAPGARAVDVAARSLVVVPDGDQLVHVAPHRVAWLHIRREGKAQRSFFDYFFVAWVRANFVVPYDTESQRRLFGAFTRYPRYWHGFLWSFIGMFFTVFACLPLAWRAIQVLERRYADHLSDEDPLPVPLNRNLPTLLSGPGARFPKHDPLRKGSTADACQAPDPLV